MPRAAKACTDPHCPNQQPCPTHERQAWAGSTRRQRLPKSWPKRRAYILRRDPICKDGRACNNMALSVEVDHVIAGDDHRYENLQGICRDCHAAKTQEEAAAARRGGG